jgi:hypothetical protein
LKKSRALALSVVLIISVLLLLPYLVGGFEWTMLESSALFAVGMIGLLVLFLTNPAQQKTSGKAKDGDVGEVKTVTSLACHRCEFSDQRDFQRGDFVGKALGECPKCKNSELYIRAIYTADEKKDGKR